MDMDHRDLGNHCLRNVWGYGPMVAGRFYSHLYLYYDKGLF